MGVFFAEDGGFRECGDYDGVYLAQEVGQQIYSPGFLDEEDYPTNAFCRWTITSPPGTLVHVFFNVFTLEIHDQCSFDHIDVFDNTTFISR